MDRVLRSIGMPPAVGKMRDYQVENQMSWAGVPDRDVTCASMNRINCVPSNSTTVTTVNPLDPATVPEGGWQDSAHTWDKVPRNSWRKL
jgi:hypothetical protein